MSDERKPTTLANLKRSREIVAPGPSSHVYKIRPLNLERHALAGGLPSSLRSIALAGAEGANRLFAGDDGQLAEQGEEVRGYLDGLVRQVIVEPQLCEDELEFLPPVDYRWALEGGIASPRSSGSSVASSSRKRERPENIRLFTVPRGTSRRSASCACVSPP